MKRSKEQASPLVTHLFAGDAASKGQVPPPLLGLWICFPDIGCAAKPSKEQLALSDLPLAAGARSLSLSPAEKRAERKEVEPRPTSSVRSAISWPEHRRRMTTGRVESLFFTISLIVTSAEVRVLLSLSTFEMLSSGARFDAKRQLHLHHITHALLAQNFQEGFQVFIVRAELVDALHRTGHKLSRHRRRGPRVLTCVCDASKSWLPPTTSYLVPRPGTKADARPGAAMQGSLTLLDVLSASPSKNSRASSKHGDVPEKSC